MFHAAQALKKLRHICRPTLTSQTQLKPSQTRQPKKICAILENIRLAVPQIFRYTKTQSFYPLCQYSARSTHGFRSEEAFATAMQRGLSSVSQKTLGRYAHKNAAMNRSE